MPHGPQAPALFHALGAVFMLSIKRPLLLVRESISSVHRYSGYCSPKSFVQSPSPFAGALGFLPPRHPLFFIISDCSLCFPANALHHASLWICPGIIFFGSRLSKSSSSLHTSHFLFASPDKNSPSRISLGADVQSFKKKKKKTE